MAEVKHPVSKIVATLGPVGFLKAPGTCATVCALPLAVLLSVLNLNPLVHGWIIICMVLGAIASIYGALSYFNHDDPREIVVDEVIGCLVAFFGIPYSMPAFLLGFLYFRFFDITKSTILVRYAQNIPGSWGVLLDDVAAGLVTNIILRFLLIHKYI